MNDALLEYIVLRIRQYAFDAIEDKKEHPGDDFYRGRVLAYYEVLDTIKNELDARDKDLEQFGLEVDLERTFLS